MGRAARGAPGGVAAGAGGRGAVSGDKRRRDGGVRVGAARVAGVAHGHSAFLQPWRAGGAGGGPGLSGDPGADGAVCGAAGDYSRAVPACPALCAGTGLCGMPDSGAVLPAGAGTPRAGGAGDAKSVERFYF